MRRLLSILIVMGIVGGFARAYNARSVDYEVPQAPQQTPDDDAKMVDLAADVVYPYEVARDSSVICLVGNFIGHHNGAVITCDSAVRYGDQRLECFGNVLINKNETYIYGDRADYNGATNRAEVYAPLVKVIDGDATLYTYRFRFDTKLNIGEFENGGVITNGSNMLEAYRGFYYADTGDVIGVDEVELRNDTYIMKGDSVIYNIDNDNARFFANTNIWNDKGEYLYADRGSYDSSEELYVITKNGYILTDIREVWSDSLDYWRERGYVLMRNDIQIDDTEHKVLAFGDWGEYWDDEGNALLTRRPSLISYDPEQGDSLFMRADTIMMHTRSTLRDREEQSVADGASVPSLPAAGEEGGAERPGKRPGSSELDDMSLPPRSEQGLPVPPGGEAEQPADTPDETEGKADGEPEMTAEGESPERTEGDELAAEGEDAGPEPELTKEERKAKLREIAEQERAEKKRLAGERKAERAKELKAKLENIAEKRQQKRNQQLERQARRDSVAQARSKAREEARRRKMLDRLNRKGVKLQPADAATLAYVDSLLAAETSYNDSLVTALWDSMQLQWMSDMVLPDSLAADTAASDTVYRLVRGFRNVKIYRSDFQAVCDSMSSSTLDSVIRMYIEPVMWHQTNQITSEQTDIHTKNQQLDYAEFIGKPMMIAELDTLHYNQVAGRTMYSYFRDNEIYRDDVDGNAETIYYMQDEETQELQGLMSITSSDMTFYIENKEITGITYRGSPVYHLYPMDKIPEDVPLFLQGFTWQAARRPSQDSVFARVVRPSVRVEKEALELPAFPIAARINAFKQSLEESNRWYDRDEKLTDDVIYWLDMNTDWREQNRRDSQMREQRRRKPRKPAEAASVAEPAADSLSAAGDDSLQLEVRRVERQSADSLPQGNDRRLSLELPGRIVAGEGADE